jgi:exonuclease III
MRTPNLRIIGVDENEDFQLKGPANIFNKIIEENFPTLKKEMPMNIQEAYRTPNRLDQKRNSSRHIIKGMKEMDLTDIYRTFYPKTKEYTFFSAPHGTFSKIDHIVCHKTGLNR